MIAWIAAKTGLSALMVKLIILAATSGAIAYGLRLYSNCAYTKGFQAGKVAAGADILKAKQSEWKTKEAAIAVDAKAVADEKLAVKAAGNRLNQDRANISQALKDALAAIQQRKEGDYANTVAAVPDSQLDAALRAISAELNASR
jgi:hypothetical protein